MTPPGSPFIFLGCIALQIVGFYVLYIFPRVRLICLNSCFFIIAFSSFMHKTVLIRTWLHWLDIHVIFYHTILNKPVLFTEMDAPTAVQPARLAQDWQGHPPSPSPSPPSSPSSFPSALHLHLPLHLNLPFHLHLHFPIAQKDAWQRFGCHSITTSHWDHFSIMYSMMKEVHTQWF